MVNRDSDVVLVKSCMEEVTSSVIAVNDMLNQMEQMERSIIESIDRVTSKLESFIALDMEFHREFHALLVAIKSDLSPARFGSWIEYILMFCFGGVFFHYVNWNTIITS